MSQSPSPRAALSLVVDRSAPASLPVQLAAAIREEVRARRLAPGDAVPASRALAEQLGVSRGTVTAAYDQLTGEGYLISHRGSATVINPELSLLHPATAPAPAAGAVAAPARESPPVIDLRPGWPDTRRLVDSGWRAAWRAAVSANASPEPPNVLGLPALRRAISEHLRLMRGLVHDPEDIIVTAGAREGLALLILALKDGRAAGAGPGENARDDDDGTVPADDGAARPGDGRRRRPLLVAVEDPGYPALRRVLRRHGADILPVPIDSDGLIVEALPSGAESPDLVIVTPNHQYPLGGSMQAARRMALLQWARENEAVIVEDDYDSEFRYIGAPLPALASLDTDGLVVNLGTFSKVLTPRLAAGYLLAPHALVGRLRAVRSELGAPVSEFVQQALEGYLSSGGLRRHISRMRRAYKNRRQLLIDIMRPLESARVQPLDGGLHAVVELPPGADVRAIVDRAARAHVLVGDLEHYWSEPARLATPGLLIGYGGVADAELERGVSTLIDIIRSATI